MSESDDTTAGTAPAPETRGGRNVDWENARPGQPLPEKPQPAVSDEEPDGKT